MQDPSGLRKGAQVHLMLAFILLTLFLDLLVWSAVLSEAQPVSLVRSLNSFVLLGLGFIITAAAIAVWAMLGPHSRLVVRLLGVLLLLVAWPALRAFQVYTDLGVFVLNGSKHWIARAADTRDPTRAKEFLGLVVSATQYGVNEAENQVLANYSPEEQAGLFMLLAEIAPNENWRRRYLARSQVAASQIGVSGPARAR